MQVRASREARTRDFRVKRRIHRVRPHTYVPGVILKPFSKLWDISNFICGKRLAPLIADYLFVLRRDRLWDYPVAIDAQLIKISAATIDRLLTPIRKKMTLKGRTITKPGTLLKHQIPVRTWADWNENIPGFFETDTVAFCGSNLSGDFAWGLNMTDVCTEWVLLELCPDRGQYAIHEGMKKMMTRLVYKVLGIDSDNGGEFINDILYRFCQFMRITFTRTRAGKKNDNCYVEQKNFTSLRTFLGYLRIETEEQIQIAQEILELAEIFINFFQSSTKLLKKERIGTRTIKHYDKALTPYKRLLKLGILSKRQRQQLYKVYSTHNPQELTQKIRVLQDKLRRACSVTFLREAIRHLGE
ncbi:MAG: integrase catalytic subunit [uncultured bacterium]|nr:MAG: integrase catalytic subunit [uncultured bacterium]